MLIYLSGPYRSYGNVDDNIKEAMLISKELWEKGHAVICPHGNTGHLDDVYGCSVTWDDYIRGDLMMIARCDAMVMMPNFKASKGAVVEYEYAESLKIPIYVYPHLPELHPSELRCPQQVKTFAEMLGQMYRVHLSKNADYSPANILGPGELGLATRLWDKVTRYMNLMGFRLNITESGTYTEPRKPKNESIDDTLMDMAVYAIIGLLLRQKVWGK